MSATYSPEDNKLRLYVGRVPRDEYETLRKAGFVSTPKQDCDFAATWTPHREDLAREYLDDGEDIGDEDYSPQERAADRAERFGDYRDRRAGEAGVSADTFQNGPTAFGHQSAAHAERQARRHDRHRTYAVSQWSKAEYWQTRTTAVIAHAMHKSSAAVRRSRILTLEAEQRKITKSNEEYAKRYRLWAKAGTMDGLDCVVVKAAPPLYGVNQAACSPAGRLVYALANSGNCYGEYTHPRTGRKTSLYSLLTDDTDPITPREAVALWMKNATDPADPSSHSARWAAHYDLRLGYERAMLAAEGGTAADADMEVGGWIGSRQVHKVNKSPATGRVVSVTLRFEGDRWGNTHEGHHMRAFNVERLPEGAYRAPTDGEREAFRAASLERKATEKAGKPKARPLVNPTDADAERLQALWNARAAERHAEAKREHRVYNDYQPVAVIRMTQAAYSAHSKGDYAACETRTVHADGRPARRSSNMYSSEGHRYDQSLPEAVCKLRMRYDAVIVLTDKPQKPLPLDWDNLNAATAAVSELVAV